MITLALLTIVFSTNEVSKPAQFIHKLSSVEKSIMIIPSTHEERDNILKANYLKLLEDADILFVEENFLARPQTALPFEETLISAMKDKGKPVESLHTLECNMLSAFAEETVIATKKEVLELYQKCTKDIFRSDLIDLAFVNNLGHIAQQWCNLSLRLQDGINEAQTDEYMLKSQAIWVQKILEAPHARIVVFVGWHHIYDEKFSIVPKLLESGMNMELYFGNQEELPSPQEGRIVFDLTEELIKMERNLENVEQLKKEKKIWVHEFKRRDESFARGYVKLLPKEMKNTAELWLIEHGYLPEVSL